MIFSILIMVALILFVNGLVVLGKFGGKQVAVLNVAVGSLIAMMALYVGFADALKGVGPTQSFMALASCLTFACTYFLLAGEIYAGSDFKCLGWYCLPAGIIMFLISLGFMHILGTALIYSTQFALFWLLWAILFWLFWGCFALGKVGAKFTGYYTLFVALFTALYPAIAFFNLGRIGW